MTETGDPIRKRKALVLGDGTRQFLSVIRSLGRGGIEVHVGACDPASPALASRYVARHHSLPTYREGDPAMVSAWIGAVTDLMRSESYDLVIPCDDPVLLPMQRHRGDLEPLGRIALLNEDAFAAVNDKLRMNELARSVGVRIPAEIIVSHSDDARKVRDQFEPPVVLKPRASYTVGDLASKQFVRKAYSWEEFDELLLKMLAGGPVAVQENFLGEGVGVELLLNHGEPLLTFQHVRVHEPLHGGGSSYRRSESVTPELLEASLKLLRPLDYTGVAMVEFKRNLRTGDWRFLEVNGRFWGSLPLAVAAGADFPLALFRLHVEGETVFAPPSEKSFYCRNLKSDLKWHWSNLRADRVSAFLATRPPLRDGIESLCNVVTGRERSDTFTLDDPRPGLRELGDLVSDVWRTLSRRVAPAFLQLPGRRGVMERQAREALVQARTVLFVCKGNICRSPFAERLASSSNPEKNWSSAGYYPHDGRATPAAGVNAAAKWNVDLSPHRSRRLDESAVEKADLLFVFDYENYQTVMRAFPAARGKVHFLGALSPAGPLLITDPFGGSESEFEAAYRSIHDALTAAVSATLTTVRPS